MRQRNFKAFLGVLMLATQGVAFTVRPGLPCSQEGILLKDQIQREALICVDNKIYILNLDENIFEQRRFEKPPRPEEFPQFHPPWLEENGPINSFYTPLKPTVFSQYHPNNPKHREGDVKPLQIEKENFGGVDYPQQNHPPIGKIGFIKTGKQDLIRKNDVDHIKLDSDQRKGIGKKNWIIIPPLKPVHFNSENNEKELKDKELNQNYVKFEKEPEVQETKNSYKMEIATDDDKKDNQGKMTINFDENQIKTNDNYQKDNEDIINDNYKTQMLLSTLEKVMNSVKKQN